MATTGGYTGLRGPTGVVGNKIPSGYRSGQMAQYTPEQSNLFQQMFSQVSPDSYLSKLAGGDQDTFSQMEAPALRQFSGMQGNIASRFSGMGSGARRSSGFQNTMSSASSNFAQDLASRRQDLQRQAIMDLMGLSNTLLGQRPYENFLVQKQRKPSWAETIGKLGGAVPGLISSFAGGGSAGDALKGAFSIFGGGNQSSPMTNELDLGFRSGAIPYY